MRSYFIAIYCYLTVWIVLNGDIWQLQPPFFDVNKAMVEFPYNFFFCGANFASLFCSYVVSELARFARGRIEDSSLTGSRSTAFQNCLLHCFSAGIDPLSLSDRVVPRYSKHGLKVFIIAAHQVNRDVNGLLNFSSLFWMLFSRNIHHTM